MKHASFDGTPLTEGVHTYSGSNAVGDLSAKGSYETMASCMKLKSSARGGGSNQGSAIIHGSSPIGKGMGGGGMGSSHKMSGGY